MRISAKTIVELAGFDLAKTTAAFISGSKFNDLDTVVSVAPGSELEVHANGEKKVAKIPDSLTEGQKGVLEVANAKRAAAAQATFEAKAKAKAAAKKETEKK